MKGSEVAQLAIVLAPVARDILVEGSKLVVTLRENLTHEEILQSLELSKSANWPQLDFGRGERE